MKKNEQNTFYFKCVHNTLFKTLKYTSFNTVDKGRKKGELSQYQRYSLKIQFK